MLTWTSKSWDDGTAASWWDHEAGKAMSVKRTETRYVSNVVEHGILDNKGRAIGNYAEIDAYQRLVKADAEPFALEAKPTYFVTTNATRDGQKFGALSTKGTACSTLEEAKVLAEKKIVAAGKRFAKAVAKGKGRQFVKVVAS
jgi:hypothetical protein